SISVPSFPFGVYSPGAAAHKDIAASITVQCVQLIALFTGYTVSVSTGAGSYASRRMTNGASTLDYNLYVDSGRTSIWGNGTGGTATLRETNLLELLNYSKTWTVYGRIPKNQMQVSPGTYGDTLIVTLVYH